MALNFKLIELIFILAHFIQIVMLSVIISKSNIEMCTQTEINSTNLNCSTKLVLSLSIENGQMNNSDYMEVHISQVTTLNNTQRILENPYKITISKSPVNANYPCIYVQDFNYHPVEQVIDSDVFTCSDGALSPNPTCGWVYINSTTVVPYSQGFCCNCDFSQIIGVDTTTATRGTSCELLNLGPGSATAHCLRFNQLWYSAYEVEKYIIDYTIDITVIYQNTSSSGNFTEETIPLSPSNVVGVSENQAIIARLIGDFSPPSPPNDYSLYYLVIPTSPSTNTMVREGPLNWMLLPQDYFTLDGRECNKIGVSYYAFQSQANACQMKVGDCLHNQIYDYYMADITNLSNNKAAKYLLSQDTTVNYQFYSYGLDKKQFSYKLSGVFNTLITLEIVADDIKFVTNVSKGKIDYVKIANFEAKSNNGLMLLQVTNIGSLVADFYVSYICSEYIVPITADEFNLAPMISKDISKNVYTLNENFKTNVCNVTLENSIGEVTDFKSVEFNTTQLVTQNNQGGNATSSNNTSNSTDSNYQNLDCSTLCPAFFDFICFVAHGCWGFFARTTAIIIICILFLIFVIKMIKKGCCCKCIEGMVKCFSGDEKKKKSKERKTEESKNQI